METIIKVQHVTLVPTETFHSNNLPMRARKIHSLPWPPVHVVRNKSIFTFCPWLVWDQVLDGTTDGVLAVPVPFVALRISG
jgi:hypothetical protein